MSSFNNLLTSIKYANLIGIRLDKFHIKSTNPYVANFRCPLCGDSKKSKSKTRGYFVTQKNELFFKCFNGCQSRSFRNFLKGFDSTIYKEFIFEVFGSRNSSRIEREKVQEEIKEKIKYSLNLKNITELSDTHPARQYVSNRLIPEEQFSRLFYTPRFSSFTNSLIPGKLEEELNEPRLIIPFINRDGDVFGYQGRSFDPKSSLRYITIMLDQTETKVFGLDKINFNKQVYIQEGCIDSLFIDNCIATAQGDLTSADHLLRTNRRIYIPDKDIRNTEVMKSIEKLIEKDKTVCLLPLSLEGKDINSIVQNGFPIPKLIPMIQANSYTGIRLRMEFSNWRKA